MLLSVEEGKSYQSVAQRCAGGGNGVEGNGLRGRGERGSRGFRGPVNDGAKEKLGLRDCFRCLLLG